MINKSWLDISKEDIDNLYAIPKIIIDDIKWQSNNNSLKIKISVYTKEEQFKGIKITLYGNVGKKYSFSLNCNNNIIIRRWDYFKHPDIQEPHKHYFDGNINAMKIYPATDIPTDDLNIAFYNFLKECNIELKGIYYQIII